MIYRPEIDGLRAVAVVPVILFHAGIDVFRGGFVGVDVFFVISGYLITGMILEDLERGEFSLLSFYERRMRRILPALYLVILVCIPFAWIWMLPAQFQDFSQSVLAISFFVSNFLFWRESGYFDAAAEEKPLLHTWSLAVEEQYYLLFPLMLILLWRFGRHQTFWIVAAIAAFSLLLTEWGWRSAPVANFYLLPTRAWEMLGGSLCAFASVGRPRRSNDAAAGLGLGLILVSIFWFSKDTPFPSLYALLPVLGTALILLFAGPSTRITGLLSNRGFVGIGLISYSAYLWHQPVFAFARIRYRIEENEPTFAITVCLALLSLLLAWASWRFVEQPFRRRGLPPLPSRKAVYNCGFAAIGLAATFGAFGFLTKGIPGRFTSGATELLLYQQNYWEGLMKNQPEATTRLFTCFLQGPGKMKQFSQQCKQGEYGADVLVIGDSHALFLSYAFFGPADRFGLYAAVVCPPLPALASDGGAEGSDHCRVFNEFVFARIAEIQPEIIVLHADWHRYVRDGFARIETADDLGKALAGTVELMHQTVPDSEIILVGLTPQWQPSLPVVMWKNGIGIEPGQSLVNNFADTLRTVNGAIQRHFPDIPNARFLDPGPLFCQGPACVTAIEYGGQVDLSIWDYGHLTSLGASYLASQILAPPS